MYKNSVESEKLGKPCCNLPTSTVPGTYELSLLLKTIICSVKNKTKNLNFWEDLVG